MLRCTFVREDRYNKCRDAYSVKSKAKFQSIRKLLVKTINQKQNQVFSLVLADFFFNFLVDYLSVFLYLLFCI